MATEEVKTAEQLAIEALDRKIAKISIVCGLYCASAMFLFMAFVFALAQVMARWIVSGVEIIFYDRVSVAILSVVTALVTVVAVMRLLEYLRLLAQRNQSKG